MSFFMPSTYNTGEFSPLFRLLDDYDLHRSNRSATSGTGKEASASNTAVTFNPRFDVRETADKFLLDGELPGMDQNDIDIQFSDDKTLSISGDNSRARAYQHQSTTTTAATAASVSEDEGSDNSNKEGAITKTQSPAPSKPKYWASERRFGRFHRTFSFPGRVDQDNVTATYRNGVLSIEVPKGGAMMGRKIAIGN